MRIYSLTLHKTYYRHGFFNVTVDYDQWVDQDDGPITIYIDERTIPGRIDHSANKNGTARIHGKAELRDWFQMNFRELDNVQVHFLSPHEIKLSK